MKWIYTILVAVAVMTLVTPAIAQDAPLVPKEHATRFFDQMTKGIWREAPGEFLKGTPLMAGDSGAADKIVKRLESFGNELGIPNGYEMLEERNIGKSVIYLVYILKFPVKPVIWELFYYRFNDKWQLISLNIPNNLNYLLLQNP